jgi:hypothetical protein
VEIERPACTQRRGRGKSDPIDAHLAGNDAAARPAAEHLTEASRLYIEGWSLARLGTRSDATP